MALNYGHDIPRISHSRCQLLCHINFPLDDRTYSFYISKDIYPELFQLMNEDIYQLAPKGWTGEKMLGLWFPELSDEDQQRITQWCSAFEQFVLLGLNPNIEQYFSDELDFCMALDFNFNPDKNQRTKYGKAEYQLKYRLSYLSKSERKKYKGQLLEGMLHGFDFLPIKGEVLITTIPADTKGQKSIAWKLAQKIASVKSTTFLSAKLDRPKQKLKNLVFGEKVKEWAKIFDGNDMLELSHDVRGKGVIIVDDLYQSGTSMWYYAKYLKSKGADYVIGYACVKALKDSDNK